MVATLIQNKLADIPEDWGFISIGECCDILDSQRVPLSAEMRRDIKGDIPYYGANGQVDSIDKWIFDEPLILMAEDGGYFDDYLNRPIAYKVTGRCWVNNHAHVLRPREANSFDWIFYQLEHRNVIPYINGSTRTKLNQQELAQIRLPLAPPLEQRKIAEILSTVDETIEKTDVIIQETQQLKKGLMQKLFTEGIRHTRFKETKIGRIPEEWEVVSIRGINKARLDSVNPANSPQEIFEYYSIPAYLECGMPAIERGESILSNKLLVTSNTVLFGKLNPRVLKVWLVKPSTTYRQVASTEFLPILPNEKAIPGFIYYLCQSAVIAENSKQYAVGTTPSRQRVNPKAFYDMPLPLPPLPEQRKVAEILSEVDTKIETEKAFKAELEQLKKGLMQVLLTGKVRVKV